MPKLYIKNRYGVIPNELLNSTSLSLKAKGLFGFLQSKPDGWSFSVERIAKQSKDGKDAVRSALKELELSGYLYRYAIKSDDGQWAGYQYILSDLPLTENPSTENPDALSKKEVVRKKKIRSFQEFIQDRASPYSTPATEDHKRAQELMGTKHF